MMATKQRREVRRLDGEGFIGMTHNSTRMASAEGTCCLRNNL